MVINKLKKINNRWIGFILLFLLIGIFSFFFINKMNNKPILIGFSAQLTGRQAELGVQERNGVQLALEKINVSGGIAGRRVELVVRDDFGIPEKARSADGELVNKGVIAIIGHATSAQTLEGLKVTNPAKVVMIGPSVSTPELSNLNDYFFRVYPSFKDSSQAFAKYIYQNNCITKIAIIYDTDNSAYSKTYSKAFTNKFQSLGGSIVNEIGFSSVKQPEFSSTLMKLRENKVEGVLIIASDIDTALIAQRIRLIGWQIPMFTSSWAPTENLINNGGQAVEEIKFEQAFESTDKSKTFNEFRSCYEARFGNDPSFGAALAYDAAMALAQAIKNTGGKPEGLKQALINIHNFSGVMGIFSFDEFGDVKRPVYISTIRNRKFVNLTMLISNNSGGE